MGVGYPGSTFFEEIYPIRNKNKMENKYDNLLVLEIEREENGILKEESVRKTVSRILTVSSIIAVESRRGEAQKIIFKGNSAWLLYEEIKRNANYLSALRIFTMESARDNTVNYIELIREGDYNYMEESIDERGEKQWILKTSRNKQPDIIERINIIEK